MVAKLPQQWTLIAGMHRSGTSATAGVVAELVGDPIPLLPRRGNPDGQWERLELRPHLDALLHAAGGTWDHPPSRTAPKFVERIIVRRSVAALAGAGPGEHVWKDPRLCLSLPVWLKALGDPRVVLVVREPWQVANSLHQRDGMPIEQGLVLWFHYVGLSLDALQGRRIFMLTHRHLMEHPTAAVDQLAAWLGESAVGRADAAINLLHARPASVGAIASRQDRTGQQDSAAHTSASELWDKLNPSSGPTVLATDLLAPAASGKVCRVAFGRLLVDSARTARRLLA